MKSAAIVARIAVSAPYRATYDYIEIFDFVLYLYRLFPVLSRTCDILLYIFTLRKYYIV